MAAADSRRSLLMLLLLLLLGAVRNDPNHLPKARSGHTMSIVGNTGFLFGGLADAGSEGAPLSEVHVCRLSKHDMEWCKLALKTGPAARWRHTAVVSDQTDIVVFGGFHTATLRCNDVWVLNTVTVEWRQPHAGQGPGFTASGNHLAASTWPGLPAPRGGHSAAVVHRGMWIFGGYGGHGYARRDLNDLSRLDLETWTWTRVFAKGRAPEPRSGHQSCAVESKVFIFGGWNCAEQFDDLFILDVSSTEEAPSSSSGGKQQQQQQVPVWSVLERSLPCPRWNFAACSVMAIPSWKIFVYGGVEGPLNETTNRRGKQSGAVAVFDVGTAKWHYPEVGGDELPEPRGDTVLQYDTKASKLVLFGGWSNLWLGDAHTLDVAHVVGPPYAVMALTPNVGPVTGATTMTLMGIDFVNTTDVVVRFSSKRGTMEVQGRYVSSVQLVCQTPDFSQFPAGDVDVRVALQNDSFTTTSQIFTFFAVTDAAKSLVFGPALLSGGAANEETMFIIQARDVAGNDRTTGGDEFDVIVKQLGDSEDEGAVVRSVQVRDRGDGTYVVTFTPTSAGDYHVAVTFAGTFGGSSGAVRGSGCTVAFDALAPRANNLMTGNLVAQQLQADLDAVAEFVTATAATIRQKVRDEAWSEAANRSALVQVKQALMQVQDRKEDMDLLIDRAKCAFQALEAEGAKMPVAQVKQLEQLAEEWAEAQREAPSIATKIAPLVKGQGKRMEQDVATYEAELRDFATRMDASALKTYATGEAMARDLLAAMSQAFVAEKTKLGEMVHLAQMFECSDEMASAEELFKATDQTLKAFTGLWDCVADVNAYVEQAKDMLWDDLDADGLEDNAKLILGKVRQQPATVKTSDAYSGLEATSKSFLLSCPLIAALKNPAMRDRHWDDVKRILTKEENDDGDANSPEKKKNNNSNNKAGETATNRRSAPFDGDNIHDMYLRDLFDLNLYEHAQEIQDLAERATREAAHEVTLANLEATWTAVAFTVTAYKETDVPLLKFEDEGTDQLEADQLALSSIVASRYDHFKGDAAAWQHELGAVSDVVQVLAVIQRTWSYLEPLFVGSDEVKKELPDEAKRFASIDANVRAILKKMAAVAVVKRACQEPGLLDLLEAMHAEQELCKKALADFLAGKRRVFPRFYFTSEADLLDILSNGSNPAKVMRHIDKVLLATARLDVQGEGHKADGEPPGDPSGRPSATTWVAGVGEERVDFEPPVRLTGKVEIYLQTVLSAQVETLSRTLQRSLFRYPKQQRTEWFLAKKKKTTASAEPAACEDPAQIALLVAGIQTAHAVEVAMEAVASGDATALPGFAERQVADLADLVKMTQQHLTPAERQRIMCLITMDAHTRDVLDRLLKSGDLAVTDFQWQSQLKYRYVEDADPQQQQQQQQQGGGGGGVTATTQIHVCDARFDYSFEYLGNGPRLVVTPLTDRFYVTATQALWLKMGCAPAGPAGTGKTETTKDLAAALGKCCYVFNCSPEMDFTSMADIFKGLAASGSWGCFDEFNRLIPEVLSVCTVQFKAVCDGVARYDRRDPRTHQVTIEEDIVSLDPTCGAFITMNPGYLGRSELPEGLKALFRPMTVMVPDLVLICENMLMAEGYVEAKSLASKFAGLYGLLRDLLSKQSHYDWGLRAIKSVLVVAGQLKRNDPAMEEDALLMRALRDFNTPKVVPQDAHVFHGLLDDLFPGVSPPRLANEGLARRIAKATEEAGLWPDATFALQMEQLDELLAIRHCVFVMGPAGAGKSSCWKTLAAAKGLDDAEGAVRACILNPKVLPTEELYGHINLVSREWKDGLLSSIMRDLGQVPDTKAKWIVLDGDLDANWIESMNSVMDDNRMLTLASNERIPLKPHMRMLFEIRDLAYATPATVSRAGILYVDDEASNQWQSVVASWVQHANYPEQAKALLTDLFATYVKPTLAYLRKNSSGGAAATVVPIVDVALVSSLLSMLDAAMKRKNDKGGDGGSGVVEDPSKLEALFVFCTVWAFGSALATSADDGSDHRKAFSEWWRGTFKAVRVPMRDTVFDYWLDEATNKFEPWRQASSFRTVDFDSRTSSMHEVTVPTTETAAISHWMRMLMEEEGRPVLLAGPSGTGKTQLVDGLLREMKRGDASSTVSVAINLNYYSTSAVLGAQLEAPLQKKTGSTYGPPTGMKRILYFVDDLNLPQVDAYNTQSAIALMRQHIDYGFWYDGQKLAPKHVADAQYVACLNPSAGSFLINPRLQRHFTTFALEMPSATSLLTIFQCFVDGHFKSRDFPAGVQVLTAPLIKAALAVHKEVHETFRKTAVHFHYEFNLRHLASVFSGLLLSRPEAGFDSAERVVHLWVHETERTYGDRLASRADVGTFKNLLMASAKKAFPAANTSQFFGHDATPENSSNNNSSSWVPLCFAHVRDAATLDHFEPSYGAVESMDTFRDCLEHALADYNDLHAEMDLVLFKDALLHVARITRVLFQPAGHAVLVGVGGSGKQSLARLAAHVARQTLARIAITPTYGVPDFKADLSAMCHRAGTTGAGVLFLISDAQITNERFLVYLNDLLASGNVDELFSKDDRDQISTALEKKVLLHACSGGAAAAGGAAACWAYFRQQVRTHLHVVCCFSPVGPAFSTYAKRFPALVNTTTIDFFQTWPRDALESVARKRLAAVDFESPVLRAAVERFMPAAFAMASDAARRYRAEAGRFVYLTPKSYLEMLATYAHLLTAWRGRNATATARLTNGIARLREAADQATGLELSLKAMLASAEETREVAEQITERLAGEHAVVASATATANEEQVKVEAIQAQVRQRQADAEKDLEAAGPAVAAAVAALDTLDKRDLGTCKTMAKPPPGVDDVFSAVAVLLAGTKGAAASTVVVQRNGKVKDKDRAWDVVKKTLLANVNGLIDDLKQFKPLIDGGAVPKGNFAEVRSYTQLEHFNEETMLKKNSSAAGLVCWVRNIVAYYDIWLEVEPKRLKVVEATELLATANAELEKVQARVAALQKQLAALTLEHDKAEKEKAEAQAAADSGKVRLELARRLTAALGSEETRWVEGVQRLEAERDPLAGDALKAAAFVCYCGPFDKPFRVDLVEAKWVPLLVEANIPFRGEKNMSVVDLLVSEAEVAQWHTEGMPRDPVSAENGAVVTTSKRWPLLIDPQLQGIAWVKRRHAKQQQDPNHPDAGGAAASSSSSSSSFAIFRQAAPDLVAGLREAMRAGATVLIENLGERVEAVLFPLLQRAIQRRGGRDYVQLGDEVSEMDADKFRLILHTKLSNPHYPPELHAELSIVNFTVTPAGLEDQLLSLVMRKERPDLAKRKATVLRQANESKVRIRRLEDDILAKLSAAEGVMITEDRALIEGLEQAKQESDAANASLVEGRAIAASIHEVSERYRNVARRGATIFFLMNALHRVHTYYMYSLNAFVVIFQHGIDLVHDAAKNANTKGGGKKHKGATAAAATPTNSKNAQQGGGGAGGGGRPPMSMLAKLKAATNKLISKTTRFGWNVDLLGAAEREDGLGALAEMALENKHLEASSQLTEEELEARLAALATSCTAVLVRYVERGCFARDRLTVSTLMAFAVAEIVPPKEKDDKEGGGNNEDPFPRAQLWRLLEPRPPAEEPARMEDSVSSWLPEETWATLKALEDGFAPALADLGDQIHADVEEWRAWYQSAEPELADLPGAALAAAEALAAAPHKKPNNNATMLTKLLVIRAMRPDRITGALRAFVAQALGADLAHPRPFDMTAAYIESSASTPIFFVLFPGVDPTPWVEALATSFDISVAKGTYANISMGQGQGGRAEAMIDRMAASGGWLMLQNVHLMQQWLPTLERKLEVAAEVSNANFRCFLSAEPPPLASMTNMPESLLQTCVKIANEAPHDLKSNLERSWANFSAELIDATPNAAEFKQCLFGLCFFHSLILGRNKFGAQGWSRAYGFNTGDLMICSSVLGNYVSKQEARPEGDEAARPLDLPWADLRYLFGDIMYGGHVTDFWDRRTSVNYLATLYDQTLLDEGREIAPGFRMPPAGADYADMTQYIREALPTETPELFGIHANAEMAYLTATADAIFEVVVRLRKTTGGAAAASNLDRSEEEATTKKKKTAFPRGGGSEEEALLLLDADDDDAAAREPFAEVRAVLDELDGRVPRSFNMVSVRDKAYPLLKSETAPYVAVAVQECARMNALVEVISTSFDVLRKGLNGQLNMSPAMDALSRCLALNQVPGRDPVLVAGSGALDWEKFASPSRKNLAHWFDDLERRAAQLADWEASFVTPRVVHISSLFNPTAFLTAVTQIVARKHSLPLDSMTVRTAVTACATRDDLPADADAGDGVFCDGFYIEGARWTTLDEAVDANLDRRTVANGVDLVGALTDSKIGDFLPPMPLIFIQALEVDPAWEPTAVGYLDNSAAVYNCPVYFTAARGATYVFLATLDTGAHAPTKWIAAGVAMLLQNDSI